MKTVLTFCLLAASLLIGCGQQNPQCHDESVSAQTEMYDGFTERIDTMFLWPEGQMPNSKGLDIKDSIANTRVFMVAHPWMDHFVPKQPVQDSSKQGAPAIVIIPGGGYARLSYELAGDMLAKWFNSLGMHAFVLYHRLPHSPDLMQREIAPLQDAQRALRIIRAHAAEWGIDPARVGAMGCSAGGHLTGTVGTHTEDVSSLPSDTLLNAFSYRPDFMVMVSPVVSLRKEITHKGTRGNLLGDDPSDELVKAWSNDMTVDETTPPALLIHADNDPAVLSINSILFYTAMRNNNRPASLHIFPSGGHSISLEPQPGTTQMWSEITKGWLLEMGFLPEKSVVSQPESEQ